MPSCHPSPLTLAALLRDRRPAVAGLLAAAALAALLSLAPPAVLVLLLDRLLAGAPPATTLAAGLALLAAAVLAHHGAHALAAGLGHGLAFRVQRDLRHRLLDGLARAPLGAVLGRSAADLRRSVLDDVESLEDGIAHALPDSVGAAVAALAVLAGLFAVDGRLALAAAAPVLAGALLLGLLMRHGRATMRAYQASQAEMDAAAIECAAALPTLRLFAGGAAPTPRIAALLADQERLARAWVDRALVPAAAGQALIGAGALAVLPYALWRHGSGDIDGFALLVFAVFGVGLGQIYPTLLSLAPRLARQQEALARLAALAALPRLADGRRLAPLPGRAGEVEFARVGFAIDGRPVLHDVSFRVAPGRSLALVGPSGAGKTSIGRLVARLWEADAGAVRVAGVDVRDLDEAALAGQVSCVLQEVILFAGSIADNIRLGRPGADDDAVAAAARAAGAHDFIAALPEGYATRLDDEGGGLSGGQRQRLSIARALLRDAPILVLDEATSFVDAENEAAIQSAIARLAAGRTLIVIAHRLPVVAGCDEILVVDDGRVAERGDHAGLLAAGGRYAALWRAQTAPRPGAAA